MADSDGPEGDSAMACSASDTRFCVRMQRGRLKRAERRRLVELGAWSLEFGALEAGKQASDGDGAGAGAGGGGGRGKKLVTGRLVDCTDLDGTLSACGRMVEISLRLQPIETRFHGQRIVRMSGAKKGNKSRLFVVIRRATVPSGLCANPLSRPIPSSPRAP